MEKSTDHAILFATEDNWRPAPVVNWYLPLLAVVVTLFAVYWGFVQPTSRQLTKMRRYVTSLETSISELNGQGAGTVATTKLLEQLVRQQQVAKVAATSLADITNLHDRLVRQAGQLWSAESALSQLDGLRVAVADHAALIDATDASLHSIQQLVQYAGQLADDAGDAKYTLGRFDDLWQQLVDRMDRMDEVAPMIDRLDALHNSVAASHDVAGALIERILQQDEQTVLAESALHGLSHLQQQLVHEGSRLTSAQEVLTQMTQLRTDVANQASLVEATDQALESISNLHHRVWQTADDSEQAEEALQQVVAIQSELNHGIDELATSGSILTDIESLHDRLVASAEQTKQARVVSENLLTLQSDLRDRGSDAGMAQIALDQLIGIRDRVEAQAVGIGKATATLDLLVDLQDGVIAESDNIIEAIESLELASDVHNQLRLAKDTLQGVQRMVVDMVIMQPSVLQAMGTLQPLSEMANLRRLDVDSLRKVVRAVGQRYHAGGGQQTDTVVADASTANVK